MTAHLNVLGIATAVLVIIPLSYSRAGETIGFTWTSGVAGIEPTNRTAERALRPAVILRKLSFGAQSASRSRHLERILTVSESCRIPIRNACESLIESIPVKFAATPRPTLLPRGKNTAPAA